MRLNLDFIKKPFQNGDLKLGLFNVITIIGSLGAAVGFVVGIFMRLDTAQNIPILVAIFVCAFSLYLANAKGRINAATSIIVGTVTLVIFPILFFTNGGAFGALNNWFCFGLVFTFLLSDGPAFYALLAAQTLAILSCYGVAYFYPEKIEMLPGKATMFIDILQALFISSICIGIIIKIQNRVYKKALKEIHEKNSALAQSEKKAEEASHAKSDFLSSMSHEIRTPINTVLGMNEMILRECEDENILDYAQSIDNAGRMLLSLINDILDFSKIESGAFEIAEEEYSTRRLFKDAEDLLKDRAEAKGLDFSADVASNIPCMLKGDDVRLRQIVINLLTNAVKYTENGSVKFQVSLQDEVGENKFSVGDTINLVIKVIDTGIGIKAENLDAIFESFSRADVLKNRHIEGTGLGLAITKRLTELMGGQISVQSEYGKGSTFTVIVPQRVSDPRPLSSVDSIQNDSARKKHRVAFTAPNARLLVVDDNAVNLKVFCLLLKNTLISTDTAESGSDSIELCRKNKYDLIFMDHMMPGMDGITAFEKIRQDEAGLNRDTRGIALTANAVSGAEDIYKEAGFTAYITKPVEPAILEATIMAMLPKEMVEPARD